MKKITFLFFFASLVFSFSACNHECGTKGKEADSTEVQTVTAFPNDKQVTYYENGQPQFLQQYLNGVKHGEYKDWFKSGQLRTMGYFNMGIREGVWQWYGEEGNLVLQVKYDRQMAQLNTSY